MALRKLIEATKAESQARENEMKNQRAWNPWISSEDQEHFSIKNNDVSLRENTPASNSETTSASQSRVETESTDFRCGKIALLVENNATQAKQQRSEMVEQSPLSTSSMASTISTVFSEQTIHSPSNQPQYPEAKQKVQQQQAEEQQQNEKKEEEEDEKEEGEEEDDDDNDDDDSDFAGQNQNSRKKQKMTTSQDENNENQLELSSSASCQVIKKRYYVKKTRTPITFETVSPLFDRPLKEAAKILGCSVSGLKKKCRGIGVDRWPFRKVCLFSFSRLISPKRKKNQKFY